MRTPSYKQHQGFRIPMGFAGEHLASALRYRARPDDIFIATYPKCGTTWMQHIVYGLFHGGDPLPPDRSMTDAIPHLEEVGREAVETLAAPRIIKTHLPFGMTPYRPEARYVYVARNPFDCVVSFYHHTRGFVRHYDFAAGSFDEYFECFVRGEVDFGDYFDNLVPWRERAEDHNVLFLTYERMKVAPREAIATVARFLDRPLDGQAGAALQSRIAHHTSFESMRENQGRWSSARPAGMPQFVRRGIVGDWRNHFSAEQAKRLASRFAERTRGTAAAELWSEIVEEARAWRGPAASANGADPR
jgi:hypothetical protein